MFHNSACPWQAAEFAQAQNVKCADGGTAQAYEAARARARRCLRRSGFAWIAIARAVGLPLADALALGRAYALRAAAEIVRDEPPAD